MATIRKDLGKVTGSPGKDANISSITVTSDSTHTDPPTAEVVMGGEPGAQTVQINFKGLQGAGANVPIATVEEVGKVKPDGETLSVDESGTIKVKKVLASTIEGEIPLANLPQGALERLVTVNDEDGRFALTDKNVQVGDIVKQTDTGIMYVVVDESKLSNAQGYVEFTAGTATEAAHAKSADKLGSSTLGKNDTPIYLNNGTPTACDPYPDVSSFITKETVATSSDVGVIKPDGETLSVDESGTLSVIGGVGGGSAGPLWLEVDSEGYLNAYYDDGLGGEPPLEYDAGSGTLYAIFETEE